MQICCYAITFYAASFMSTNTVTNTKHVANMAFQGPSYPQAMM